MRTFDWLESFRKTSAPVARVAFRSLAGLLGCGKPATLGLGLVLCLTAPMLAQQTPESADEDAAVEEAPIESIPTTHREVAPIEIELGPAGKLETFTMDAQGRLILGVSWVPGGAKEPAEPIRRPRPGFGRRPFGPGPGRGRPQRPFPPQRESENRKYAIQILDPSGKRLQTWKMPNVETKNLHATEDGELYVAGSHRLVRLDARGKQLAYIEISDLLEGQFDGAHASGITVNDQYVFLALGAGRSLRATEDIVRFNRDLSHPKLVVEKQFGCCAHIDLECRSGELLVAENSRHRVNRFTFDGELLGRWGRRDREGIEGFAACCNPVNIDLGNDGRLYTAESGIGRVKMFNPDGTFLGLLGYVDTTQFDRGSRLASISCYIPIEVSADGNRIYVMDVRKNFIRVLERDTKTP